MKMCGKNMKLNTYINSLNFPKFLVYRLQIKINSVAMLHLNLSINNVSVIEQILKLHNWISGKILVNQVAHLPRFNLNTWESNEKNYYIYCTEYTFPVVWAFGIIANKSHGKSFDLGEMFVASYHSGMDSIIMLPYPDSDKKRHKNCSKCVWKDAL